MKDQNTTKILSYLNTWMFSRINGVLHHDNVKIVKRGDYICKGGYIFGTKLVKIPSSELSNAQARKIADAIAIILKDQ